MIIFGWRFSAQGHQADLSPSCASPDNLPRLKAVVAGDNCQQFDLTVVPAMTATAPPLFGQTCLPRSRSISGTGPVRVRPTQSTKRRARSRHPLLPWCPTGPARRAYRPANCLRTVAGYSSSRGSHIRQQFQRPATALSAGRHILNARNSISPAGAAR